MKSLARPPALLSAGSPRRPPPPTRQPACPPPSLSHPLELSKPRVVSCLSRPPPTRNQEPHPLAPNKPLSLNDLPPPACSPRVRTPAASRNAELGRRPLSLTGRRPLALSSTASPARRLSPSLARPLTLNDLRDAHCFAEGRGGASPQAGAFAVRGREREREMTRRGVPAS
ncbi:uncharacterized protein SCHCODRAFT_02521308 [Schizophyllum commune H4-8]|nr:uncharacterized protein SCHCODRAFT_02521308 [Schizophyllum commune H4-8]KAI5885033.1 hypothetical protein SCHCODRAFT_02521308 [Schizophyllum commune H4-8]